jgi:hypothetical protein
MKNPFFVSDAMTPANPYQFDSHENGALGMACQRAAPYAAAARADGTRVVYAGAWARWATWCKAMHTVALPAAPEAVAAYLAELAGVATIKVTLSAILYLHREQCHRIEAQAPAIVTVMAGITRRESRPIRRAAALELNSLRRTIVGMTGDDVRSVRDRALLLVGFFGALRRSELVSLDCPPSAPVGQFELIA